MRLEVIKTADLAQNQASHAHMEGQRRMSNLDLALEEDAYTMREENVRNLIDKSVKFVKQSSFAMTENELEGAHQLLDDKSGDSVKLRFAPNRVTAEVAAGLTSNIS